MTNCRKQITKITNNKDERKGQLMNNCIETEKPTISTIERKTVHYIQSALRWHKNECLSVVSWQYSQCII